MGLTNDEADRLTEILSRLGEVKSKLTDRERQFIDDQEKRFDEQGAGMRLSGPQWKWLNDIDEKYA